MAVMKAKEYYEDGYRYVVDIDLAKYFDTVNHDILMDMVNGTYGGVRGRESDYSAGLSPTRFMSHQFCQR